MLSLKIVKREDHLHRAIVYVRQMNYGTHGRRVAGNSGGNVKYQNPNINVWMRLARSSMLSFR